MKRIILFLVAFPCYLWSQGMVVEHQSAHTVGFEKNKGQVWTTDQKTAQNVQYHYHKGKLDLFLLQTGMAYQFSQFHHAKDYPASDWMEKEQQTALHQPMHQETYRMDMELVGANPHAVVVAEGRSKDYVNYYNRNALEVHCFQKLTYQDIYPGIDWVIYTTEQGLKYDFVVRVGADPQQIKMRFKHHEALAIQSDGSFTASNRMGAITEQAPISFQGDKKIETRFQLDANTLSFELTAYDPNQVLIIDPSLAWATYYGGSGAEYGEHCTTDTSDNVYLAGYTSSVATIAAGGHQINYGGGAYDAFVAKFNSSGMRQWATYYGGSSSDFGLFCAVDGNGAVYLSGHTESNLGIAAGGHQTTAGGAKDAFLVKLNSNGIRQWGTFYGAGSNDFGGACTVDGNGMIYWAGSTESTTDIAMGGHQTTIGGARDAFLVKFNSNGVRQWSTYYGGSGSDNGQTCFLDGNGAVYLAGSTTSTTGIALGGHQNNHGGATDGFVVKFNSSGIRQWATYYGGAEVDNTNYGIADGSGAIYLTGWTQSTTAIASNGHQNSYGGGFCDGFLVKLNDNGVRQWATYYGNSGLDQTGALAVDGQGAIYLSGQTNSTTSIASGGYQNTFGGGSFDGFLAKFNSSGIRQWGTYYGNTSNDRAKACAIDNNGAIYLAGITLSIAGIASRGHQTTHGGSSDAFLVKLGSQVVNTLLVPMPNTTVQLYPNPTTSMFTVDMGGLRQNVTLQLRSLTGKLIREEYHATLQQTQWELTTAFPQGMYVLSIQIAGEEPIHHKIIKQ